MKNAVCVLSLSFVVASCSSAPIVPVAPTVEVARFNSVLITPETIHFQAQVVINNRMRGKLSVEKVAWEADLHDQPVESGTFNQLHPMRARAQQTVTLPFQIPMKNVVDQAVDVLAEEAVRVSLRGNVHPVGFGPVPFQAERTIPLPKIPTVVIGGTDGNPLQGAFTVFLKVTNNNDFAMALGKVDSHLSVNGKKYDLLNSRGGAEMGPGQSAKVALSMQQTRGKGLSMALGVLQSKGMPRFEIGGSFSFNTPHGLIQVPLKLSSD